MITHFMVAKIQYSGIICSSQVATFNRMPKKFRRAYPTVQAWMEATGTNQAQLAKQLGISTPHLSNILSKSRRCSLYVALKISKLTNVPIESLVEWPASYKKAV